MDAAVIERVRARAESARDARDDRRERMRREYPKHAAIVDAFRAANIDLTAPGARVTVDGVTFRRPGTPDVEPPPILRVSVFAEGLKTGVIVPSGKVRHRGQW